MPAEYPDEFKQRRISVGLSKTIGWTLKYAFVRIQILQAHIDYFTKNLVFLRTQMKMQFPS